MEKSAHVQWALETQEGGAAWQEHELQPKAAQAALAHVLPVLTTHSLALYHQMELHCSCLQTEFPGTQRFPSTPTSLFNRFSHPYLFRRLKICSIE